MTQSIIEYLTDCAALEVQADIEAGKIPATDCDPDLIIDCLVRKLIARRMTTRNIYGPPEYTILADRGMA